MTSITWRDAITGLKTIKIYRSKDALDKVLKSTTKKLVGATYEFHWIEMKKNKVIKDLVLHSVSYEEDDEQAMFRKYGIIPKEDEYD